MFVRETFISRCVKRPSKYARMFKNVFGSGFLVRTAHVFLTWVITLVLFLHDTGKSRLHVYITYNSAGTLLGTPVLPAQSRSQTSTCGLFGVVRWAGLSIWETPDVLE